MSEDRLYQRIMAPGESLEDPQLVREAVFVHEQGFSLELEMDELDAVCHHVVFYDSLGPVATGRVYPDEAGVYHIGRVAVMERQRGTGIGRQLMLALEQVVAELGGGEITLGAQCQASGFYASLGYTPSGEGYDDEGCPHIPMSKRLG